MTASVLMLTLILNGVEVDMPLPVIAATGDHGTRLVAIPVRESFEAAGFVVQFHDREEPHVAISGYVDRLPARARLVRVGILHEGRDEVRVSEYVAAMPFATERIEGRLYAPAMVLRIIAGGDLSLDLDAGRLYWDTYAPEAPPMLSVRELVADLPRWLHRRVRVEGIYRGSDAPAADVAMPVGAPAPGAWAVSDDTGVIYCTDALWIGRLVIRTPALAEGDAVAVEGIVRPGWAGLPYLSDAEVIVQGAP